MKAGELDRWIEIQERQLPELQDDMGGPVEVWEELCHVWAAFEQAGGREFPIAEKLHAESTARFRIRYRDGLKAGLHRIAYSVDCDASPIPIWDIKAVNHVGRRIETHLEVSEIV